MSDGQWLGCVDQEKIQVTRPLNMELADFPNTCWSVMGCEVVLGIEKPDWSWLWNNAHPDWVAMIRKEGFYAEEEQESAVRLSQGNQDSQAQAGPQVRQVDWAVIVETKESKANEKKTKESKMSMFDGIETARSSEGGVYFKPGVYRTKVLACKSLKTRKGIGAFVVETELLSSTEPSLPAGTLCSWVVTLDKEPALGNIKSFIAAAMHTETKDVTAAAVDMVVSAGNPLKDVILKVSAQNIKTKAGTDFTKITWLPDDGQ